MGVIGLNLTCIMQHNSSRQASTNVCNMLMFGLLMQGVFSKTLCFSKIMSKFTYMVT